jgi:hypothetical protein
LRGVSRGVYKSTDRFLRNMEVPVRELVRYLIGHLCVDFEGDISMDKVREFLREDDTREARSLLSKLIDDKGVDDLLITIADCLKDHIRTGITEDTLREQLTTYSES